MKILPIALFALSLILSAPLFAQSSDTISIARAEQIYLRMLKKDSKNAIANTALAKISFERNDYHNANQYASAALDAGADTVADVWLMYIKALDGDGRTDNAIKKCQKALLRFPENANLWAEYGFLNFKYRDYLVAIKACEKSLNYQPFNPDACVVYGLSLYERSNSPQAALPILYALLIDNRKEITSRNCWLFMQLAKQKHANIPIPYYEKRLAIIDPIQITTFMYPEKSFKITLETFDETEFRITADEYVQNLKGENNSPIIKNMQQLFSDLKKDKHQNTALYVAMRDTENKSVTDWLKIHSEDIRQYASWLDKHLPQMYSTPKQVN